MTYSARDHKAKPAAQAARSAARIGAAQALYQMDLAGADVSDVIHEFTTLRFPNSEAGETIAGADPPFFAALLLMKKIVMEGNHAVSYAVNVTLTR